MTIVVKGMILVLKQLTFVGRNTDLVMKKTFFALNELSFETNSVVTYMVFVVKGMTFW